MQQQWAARHQSERGDERPILVAGKDEFWPILALGSLGLTAEQIARLQDTGPGRGLRCIAREILLEWIAGRGQRS